MRHLLCTGFVHALIGMKPSSNPLMIPAAGALLAADLELPSNARGLVIFVHGSGSSRQSPRNRLVATKLREAGLGTLLLDLQTDAERTGTADEDLAQLARRLVAAVRWLREQPATAGLSVGLFGASTGAAVALAAAAELGSAVAALVARGGRPDLVPEILPKITCPVQLIVGACDTSVLALNEAAFNRLHGARQLSIVPRATHLFEEPGTLDQVARWSAVWFASHLQP